MQFCLFDLYIMQIYIIVVVFIIIIAFNIVTVFGIMIVIIVLLHVIFSYLNLKKCTSSINIFARYRKFEDVLKHSRIVCSEYDIYEYDAKCKQEIKNIRKEDSHDDKTETMTIYVNRTEKYACKLASLYNKCIYVHHSKEYVVASLLQDINAGAILDTE